VIRGSRLLKTVFGRTGRWNEYREVVWCAPKRLPSRRCANSRGQNAFNSMENEDDDEDDYEGLRTPLQPTRN
jgi:hypothetical protein